MTWLRAAHLLDAPAHDLAWRDAVEPEVAVDSGSGGVAGFAGVQDEHRAAGPSEGQDSS
jgi:hypothetical protein